MTISKRVAHIRPLLANVGTERTGSPFSLSEAGAPFKPSFGLSGAVDPALVLAPDLDRRFQLFTCHPERSEGPRQGSNMLYRPKPLNPQARAFGDPQVRLFKRAYAFMGSSPTGTKF